MTAEPVTSPLRTLRIGSTLYPLVLPRLQDSRLHVAGVVITLHVLGQIGLRFHVSVPQILAAILTCAILQIAITFFQTREFVWPASALLTGSGIALILRVPTTPVGDHWTLHKLWLFAGVSAFSLLTKFIIRRNGSHIFNPSNIGLVLAFVILGSSRVEPLDFWWAPISNPAMVVAYAVILIGGSIVTKRLGLLSTVLAFWLILIAGTAVNATAGQCFTARWAFAPVCGANLWLAIVTSPEVFIFTYFMITDPRTVPRGRVGRIIFGGLVGVVCVLLMAPQQTEFGAKVALLAGLTIVTAVRPLLERFIPQPATQQDTLSNFAKRIINYGRASTPLSHRLRRGVSILLAIALVLFGLTALGNSTKGILAGEPENLIGRLATRIDPTTFPVISVDQQVIDWNHEIDVEGARQIVLTLAENLALESQALIEKDSILLEAINHGDRLEAMQERVSANKVVVERYTIDEVNVTLLVPFGRQDGLSLGLISQGTVVSETFDADGLIVSSRPTKFKTMWAMRRATGSRWLIIAELPVPDLK